MLFWLTPATLLPLHLCQEHVAVSSPCHLRMGRINTCPCCPIQVLTSHPQTLLLEHTFTWGLF